MQQWVKSQMTAQFTEIMKLMDARLPAPALCIPAALGAPATDTVSVEHAVDEVPVEDALSVVSLKYVSST